MRICGAQQAAQRCSPSLAAALRSRCVLSAGPPHKSASVPVQLLAAAKHLAFMPTASVLRPYSGYAVVGSLISAL